MQMCKLMADQLLRERQIYLITVEKEKAQKKEERATTIWRKGISFLKVESKMHSFDLPCMSA